MRKFAWIAVLLLACSKPSEKASAGDGAPTASAGRAGAEGAGAGSAIEQNAEAASVGGEKEHHRKHEDRREPVVANAPPLKLVVSVKGQAVTWDQAAFDKVAKYTKGTDGEARDVWSLRELAHQLVGPNARVATVTGEDGTKVIDTAAWNDDAKTPLLHTTRRGTLKFRWADANGRWGESEMKDVAKIEIVR